MSAPSPVERPTSLPAIDDVRARVDRTIEAFLDDRRAELAALDPAAAVLVEEIRRLVDAGGKRIRPVLCICAYRAAGGIDLAPIVRAAAGLELLHTFALIHDDAMDGSDRRRGVETTHVRFARGEDPAGVRRGLAVAILVGDLAAVFAEQLLRTCGASGERLVTATTRFDRMRLEMAAGQLLDLERSGASDRRVAALKTSSYTAEGPILIASALAGAPAAVERPLALFGRHLGEAFQLRDDVLDGDAADERSTDVDGIIERALGALDGAPLDDDAADALRAIAGSLRLAEPA